MKQIPIYRFDGGMTESNIHAAPGEFNVSKHFDILTYPYTLYPTRGMVADTSNTGIGMIQIGSDNGFWAVGGDYLNTNTNSAIWKRGGSSWSQFTHTGGDVTNFNLLLEYHKSDATRIWLSAGTNEILINDFADVGVTTHSLTFSKISQGYLHPDDDVAYIPYDNFVAANNNGSWTDKVLTLPANYRATSCTKYGTYLAISACPQNGGNDAGGGGLQSKVFLWDRSATTWNQSIDWGAGNLLLINNLGGNLIGLTDLGGRAVPLDYDSIQIKEYTGTVPTLIKEIPTVKQTSTAPDANINTRVNFVYRDRLYFSINIASGSTSPSYYGLWSLGKSKVNGRYAVTIEKMATLDGSETSVLAAAIASDYVSMCYNTAGTIVFSNALTGTSAPYTATSIYESSVNPEMPPLDFAKQKQLFAFTCQYLPLPSGASVVAKYRVDGGAWITIFTETTAGAVVTERIKDATPREFTAGRNYEFHLESTGGAQIVGFTYRYDEIATNI